MSKAPLSKSARPTTVPAHAPVAVIENLHPCLEGGRHPVKRIVGEPLDVFADIFKDGHDVMSAVLKWRMTGHQRWSEAPMHLLDNDRWKGTCRFDGAGRWEYEIEAWGDTYRSWKKSFAARCQAQDPDVPVEALDGARLLREAAQRATAAGSADVSAQLDDISDLLSRLPADPLLDVLLSDELQSLIDRYPDRALSSTSALLRVIVERPLARFSSWYEFFPRNAEGIADKHSTFRDCLPRLDDAREMGFNVIYFPPIHPIGVSHRKGKNNTLTAQPGDVGSPWAIGGPRGGHYDVEPALGTIDDFIWLVGEANKRGLEIALDFALNCSPDHPYVSSHPDWFYQRPDGSIRYAENPPKKYQDIYPLNFHCADWRNLWRELIDVVLFWVDKGVKIFRVDNPHTKPVAFWELLIADVQQKDADVIFLSEAFTKPRMMEALGKVGFTQSYTYFTWRETKHELEDYCTQLTRTDMRWYYRANFWPNTPDILPGHLQNAGPQMFRIRAALAATLSSCWGMYSGYEHCENDPYPGKEEYNHSEKYEIKQRDWDGPGNIKAFIRELNRIRNEQPAMQLYDNLTFHAADHQKVMCYSRSTEGFTNRMLCVVNLDPKDTVSCNVHLDLGALGIDPGRPFKVHDLLHGAVYEWHGATNFVSLNPNGVSMHLFRAEQ